MILIFYLSYPSQKTLKKNYFFVCEGTLPDMNPCLGKRTQYRKYTTQIISLPFKMSIENEQQRKRDAAMHQHTNTKPQDTNHQLRRLSSSSFCHDSS